MNDSPLELAGEVKASMPCYIAGDLEVVGPDDPQKECLKIALNVCLEVCSLCDLFTLQGKEPPLLLASIIFNARKAVELGSKLQ